MKEMQAISKVSTLHLQVSQVLKHCRWNGVITQPIMFYLIYLIIYNWLILLTGTYFCEGVDHQRVNNRALVPAVAPH